MNTLQRDWHDIFTEWQADIDLDPRVLEGYALEAKFDDFGGDGMEIPFGHYAGQPRWESMSQVPHSVRDQLFDLIVVQGDTEFASVEQQKLLVYNAPSEYDRAALIRVMREEMRHGYQMCHLLNRYFGPSGEKAARGQLERRSGMDGNQRLLGAFNAPVDNWLDFFTYTMFVDRDGKYQLLCLSHSGFAPLGRSTRYMLREESFHLGTGMTGLARILKAGVVSTGLMQRYFNKWIPTALDLFGNDQSTSANWSYERSLKGRPFEMDELRAGHEADRGALNEHARQCYYDDIVRQIERLNALLPAGAPPLYTPSVKFNRGVGLHKQQAYTTTGEPMAEAAYAAYYAAQTPSEADKQFLLDLQADPSSEWVQARDVAEKG